MKIVIKQQPETPLPWRFSPWHIEEADGGIRAEDGHLIGTFAVDRDGIYAVHAANLCPLLIEALRAVLAEYRPTYRHHGTGRHDPELLPPPAHIANIAAILRELGETP